MNSRFASWFRGLSNGQAFIVYGFCVVFALLTLWHNPADGYHRRRAAIRTDSAQDALSNMKMHPDENDWEYCENFWKEYGCLPNGYLPNGGNFYWKKNPWWWVYAYESEGFDADLIPGIIRPYLLSLETLGGYMQTVVIVGFSAFFFIFLFGIRKSHPK